MSAAKRAPAMLLPQILRRDLHQCVYCGARPWEEIEHLIPRRHGGPSVLWNLALSCVPCNRRKSAKVWPEAIDKLIRNLRLMVAETRLHVDYHRGAAQLRAKHDREDLDFDLAHGDRLFVLQESSRS